MANEASPAAVANTDPVSSPSEPSWYLEPPRGFLSASLGELGQSETLDLISVNTVQRHVGNILSKTGLANRTQAASYAHQAGIV